MSLSCTKRVWHAVKAAWTQCGQSSVAQYTAPGETISLYRCAGHDPEMQAQIVRAGLPYHRKRIPGAGAEGAVA